MAKWGKIGGRGRRTPQFFVNARDFVCMYMRDGELLSGGYRTAQPYATEVADAVEGFLEGVDQINVPNDRKFCAAVRQQYYAAREHAAVEADEKKSSMLEATLAATVAETDRLLAQLESLAQRASEVQP
jgi:hypothetical protein